MGQGSVISWPWTFYRSSRQLNLIFYVCTETILCILSWDYWWWFLAFLSVWGEFYLNCAVGAMLKLELQPNMRARSSPGVKAQTLHALRLVWSLVPHGLLSIAGCSPKGPQSLCGWSPKYMEPKGLISIILLDSWLEPQNCLLVA